MEKMIRGMIAACLAMLLAAPAMAQNFDDYPATYHGQKFEWNNPAKKGYLPVYKSEYSSVIAWNPTVYNGDKLYCFFQRNVGPKNFTTYGKDNFLTASGYNDEFWREHISVSAALPNGTTKELHINSTAPLQDRQVKGPDGYVFCLQNVLRLTFKEQEALPGGTVITVTFPEMKNGSTGTVIETPVLEFNVGYEYVMASSMTSTALAAAMKTQHPNLQPKEIAVRVSEGCVLSVDDDFECANLYVVGRQTGTSPAGVVISPRGSVKVNGNAFFLPCLQHKNRNMAYLINNGKYEATGRTYFFKPIDKKANHDWADQYGYFGDRATAKNSNGVNVPLRNLYNRSVQTVAMPVDDFSDFRCDQSLLLSDVYLYEQNNKIKWNYAPQVTFESGSKNHNNGNFDEDFQKQVSDGFISESKNQADLTEGNGIIYYNANKANKGLGLLDYDLNTKRPYHTYVYEDATHDFEETYFMPNGRPNDAASYTFPVIDEVSDVNACAKAYVKNPYQAPLDWRSIYESNSKLAEEARGNCIQGGLGFLTDYTTYNAKTGFTTFDGDYRYGYLQPQMSDTRFTAFKKTAPNGDPNGEGSKMLTTLVTVSKDNLTTYDEVLEKYSAPNNLNLPYIRFYCDDPAQPKGEGKRSVCVVYFLPLRATGRLPGYADLVDLLRFYSQQTVREMLGVDADAYLNLNNEKVTDYSDYQHTYYGINNKWEAPLAYDDGWVNRPNRFPVIGMSSRNRSCKDYPTAIRALPLSNEGPDKVYDQLRNLLEIFVDKRQKKVEYGILDYGNLGDMSIQLGDLRLNCKNADGSAVTDVLSAEFGLPQGTETTEDGIVKFSYPSGDAVKGTDTYGMIRYTEDADGFDAAIMTKIPSSAQTMSEEINEVKSWQEAQLFGQDCNILVFPMATTNQPCIYHLRSVDAEGKTLREDMPIFEGKQGGHVTLGDEWKSFVDEATGIEYSWVSDDGASVELEWRGSVVTAVYEKKPATYEVHYVNAADNSQVKAATTTDLPVLYAGEHAQLTDAMMRSFTADKSGSTVTYVYNSDDSGEVAMAATGTNVVTVKFDEVANTTTYSVKFVDQDGNDISGAQAVETAGATGGHPVFFASYADPIASADGQTYYFYDFDDFDKVTIAAGGSSVATVHYKSTQQVHYVVRFVDGDGNTVRDSESLMAPTYKDSQGDYSAYTKPFVSDDKRYKYQYDSHSYSFAQKDGKPEVTVTIEYFASDNLIPYTVHFVCGSETVKADEHITGQTVKMAGFDYSAFTKDVEAPGCKYVYAGNDFYGRVKKDSGTEVTITYTKVSKVDYTLKYVDAAGNAIAGKADVTLSDYVGEPLAVPDECKLPFTITAGDGTEASYKYDSDDAGSKTITATAASNVVKIKCNIMSATVKYSVAFKCDATEVKPAVTGLIGEAGEAPQWVESYADPVYDDGDEPKIYTTKQTSFDGVTLQAGDENSMTVNFTEVAQIPYTLKFVDGDGVTIKPDEHVTADVANPDFSSYLEDVPGTNCKYTYSYDNLSSVPRRLEGTTVTLTFDKISDITLTCTIKFLNRTTNVPFANDVTVTAYPGQTLEMLDSYRPADTDDGINITRYECSNTLGSPVYSGDVIRYVYADVINEVRYTVQFVDGDGKAIKASETLIGPKDKDDASGAYDEYKETIVHEGFRYSYASNTYDNQSTAGTVTITYTKEPKVGYTLKYVDAAGNAIADKVDVTLDGYEGEPLAVPDECKLPFTITASGGTTVSYKYGSDDAGDKKISATAADNVVTITCNTMSQTVQYSVAFKCGTTEVKQEVTGLIGEDGGAPQWVESYADPVYVDGVEPKIYTTTKTSFAGITLQAAGGNNVTVDFTEVKQIPYTLKFVDDKGVTIKPDEQVTAAVASPDFSDYQAEVAGTNCKYTYSSNDLSTVLRRLEGTTVTLAFTKIAALTCTIEFLNKAGDVAVHEAVTVTAYPGEKLEMLSSYQGKKPAKTDDGVNIVRYEYNSNTFDTPVAANDLTRKVYFDRIEEVRYTINFVDDKEKKIKDSETLIGPKDRDVSSGAYDAYKTIVYDGYYYNCVNNTYGNQTPAGTVVIEYQKGSKTGIESVVAHREAAQPFVAYGGKDHIRVLADGAVNVDVFSLSGVKVASLAVRDEASIAVRQGVYIVTGRGVSVKVSVR